MRISGTPVQASLTRGTSATQFGMKRPSAKALLLTAALFAPLASSADTPTQSTGSQKDYIVSTMDYPPGKFYTALNWAIDTCKKFGGQMNGLSTHPLFDNKGMDVTGETDIYECTTPTGAPFDKTQVQLPDEVKAIANPLKSILFAFPKSEAEPPPTVIRNVILDQKKGVSS